MATTVEATNGATAFVTGAFFANDGDGTGVSLSVRNAEGDCVALLLDREQFVALATALLTEGCKAALSVEALTAALRRG